MAAHGRASLPICTQHGLQDGGLFVALNCPFVVSLWVLNSSLCLLTDKASANSYLSYTHACAHTNTNSQPVKGVGNDVASMSDHKLTNELTHGVTADASISLSQTQTGVCPGWSHLLEAAVSSEPIKNGPPIYDWYSSLRWMSSIISGVYLHFTTCSRDWLGGRFVQSWRQSTHICHALSILDVWQGVLLLHQAVYNLTALQWTTKPQITRAFSTFDQLQLSLRPLQALVFSPIPSIPTSVLQWSCPHHICLPS